MAVPGAQALLAGPRQSDLPSPVADLRGEQAILDRVDPLPAAGGMESADEVVGVVLPEGVLQLVAIAPLGQGGHDRLHRETVELADPPQRILDLLGLDL